MSDPLMPHFLELPITARDIMARYEQQYRGGILSIPTGRMWNELYMHLQSVPRTMQPQPAPTEPGWYYAQRKGLADIIPVEVEKGTTIPLIVWSGREDALHDFVWFGRVPLPTAELVQP